MNRFESVTGSLMWIMALLLSALVAGCGGGGGGGGGRGPILGGGGHAALAPTVIATAPAATNPIVTGVAISTKIITAAFSKEMNPATLTTTSFTLECPDGTPITGGGAVTYLEAGNVATLPLPAGSDLPPSTICTGTITTAARDTTGIPLANNFVWTFETGVTPDTTRPRVTLTVPATTSPGPTTGVPTNTAITALFTEDMAPASIVSPATTFTVTCGGPCTSPVGDVTYSVGSMTATFALPGTDTLEPNTTYTATITTAATDLATNALAGNQAALPAASNYVWTFTTGAGPTAPGDITVQSTNPGVDDVDVCPGATINATFDVPSGARMNDASVAASFFVTELDLTPVPAASIVLDGPTGTIATFTPQAPLTDGVTYTATIAGGAIGVKDETVPANEMVDDYTWNFTAGPATGVCLAPIDMGAATPFALAATAGLTNTPTGPVTTINGDVVLDPNQTCNLVTVPNDGTFGTCGGVPSTPVLNGTVVTDIYPNTSDYLAVKADLNAAFLSITPPAGPPAVGSLGGGTTFPAPTTLGDLAGNPLVFLDNYFTPGVYTSGSVINISGDITLDALGNPDAVFVFQAGSALNIAAGAPGPAAHTRILLTGGATASNVWWQVGSSATIGTYAEFNGNVLAAYDITMETGAVSCGRMMSGAWVAGSGALIFDANVVSVPGNGCPP